MAKHSSATLRSETPHANQAKKFQVQRGALEPAKQAKACSLGWSEALRAQPRI